MNFQNFLSSLKKIGLHIGIIIGVGILIFIIITISLKVFTHHGDKNTVPDFSGLSIEKAQELATLSKLRIEVIDSVFDHTSSPGIIVDQTPKPGLNVKENRTIFITSNSVLPEMVQMPDLLNISLRQAQSIIDIYGLKLGKLKYVPDFAKNYVLAQMVNGENIETGIKIAKGTKIDLLLGLGDSNKETALPNLVGTDLQSSLNRITRASLNLGARIFDGTFETEQDSMAAIVVKQSPRYEEGTTVKMGSLIDLWLREKAVYDSLYQLDSLSLKKN